MAYSVDFKLLIKLDPFGGVTVLLFWLIYHTS